MDKYTVDLDQVLNDFEYRELTTEQQQQQPAAADVPSTYAKTYSNAKHSINNVFSSLNEYLNSDISERTGSTSQPSPVAVTPVKDIPLASLIAEPILLRIEQSNEFDLDEHDDGEDEDVPVEVEVELHTHTEALAEEHIEDAAKHNEMLQVMEEEPETKLEMHNVDSSQDGDHVTCVNGNTNEIQLDRQLELQVPEEKMVEIVELKDETVCLPPVVNNCCDKVTIGFHNLQVDDEEAKKYLEDLQLTDEDDDEDEDFHDVEEPQDKTEEPVAICEESDGKFKLRIRIEAMTQPRGEENDTGDTTQPEISIDHEQVPIVALNEEETPQQMCIVEELVVEDTRADHDHEMESQENAAEAQRPNSLDIKEETVNLIGNPGSTPYNNLYVSKEVSGGHVQQQYESESSASISPTFSEASTDSVRSVESPILRNKHGAKRKTTTVPAKASEDEEHEEAAAAEKGDNEDDEAVEAATSSHNQDVIPMISEDEDVYVDLDSIGNNEPVESSSNEQTSEDSLWLGKRAPLWIPDADALCCQHCELKFTVIKRRHHCRACGLVLCSKCCNMKHKLEYLQSDARVCTRCFDVLNRDTDSGSGDSQNSTPHRQQPSTAAGAAGGGQPNPNNPMEYCSVVPPHQQVATTADGTPPSVMVPVGVLKRKGSNKKHNKSVMFCDGIRPGSDLTNLDSDFNYNDNKKVVVAASQSQANTTAAAATQVVNVNAKKTQHQVPINKQVNKNLPLVDPVTQSFIPENENCLPPTVTTYKSDITYSECGNNANVVEMLKNETLTFAVQRNLYIHVRLINMDCCVNKHAWCFSTEGLITVGQDEIVILLETMEDETQVPKDVFHHLNNIYNSAVKGTTVTELGLSIHPTTNFLDSRNHAGFIFVRPTFQCLQHVLIPKEPYLVGILVHRWETPWARIFPLRLVLRLGAEYRYYPSPLISTRHRDSVFVEIGHTIINLLADFRNFSYTLPNIRGLTIHMEEKSTTVSIPANRYEQVMKSISNSSEHILAFGGNFSSNADSHLVCIQDTQGSNENNYKTHAINIQNKPRKVTGASFIVFNGALKSSSGLTAKSSIVEDGLMIQIPPEHMVQVRESLRNMKNHTIQCGCVNAASDETVNIVWSDSDINFNLGVKSSVDGQSLSGIPSIRVHNGKDYTCNAGGRLIRWTEVFLLQNGEENARTQDPVDISKVAESISKATCQALVKYLDLLATNHFMKIGIRTTLHVDDVSYTAGSNGTKLPPIYMKSLDNELVPVLHRITSAGNVGDGTIVLELIFRILNV